MKVVKTSSNQPALSISLDSNYCEFQYNNHERMNIGIVKINESSVISYYSNTV